MHPAAGARSTFRQLFDRHPIVEVPIVQRDYVQGRKSEVEVRTGFVSALAAALAKPPGDPNLPLDLDFVYGSVEKTDRKAFSPLDGQQRLTTLFLLHWYLAWQDGKLDDFREFAVNADVSRFIYAVRPSSGEFFNELARWEPAVGPKDLPALSDLIRDQPWFFRSWMFDPTIQAVLTMLDALHGKFAGQEGLYDRLVQADQPYITFQLLDLRSFGLSDDLYIKMNGRGKPLTPFETFKARFEKHLDTVFSNERRVLRGKQVPIRDYFSHRIDTDWADLFWCHRDEQTQLFDDRVMHLIRALAIVTRDPDGSAVDKVLEELGTKWIPFGFLKLKESGCLDRPLLEMLIAMLDGWSGGGGELRTHLPNADFFDEQRIFEKAITRSAELTYEELVQFHAYCAYILKHESAIAPEPFSEWMRVVRNLSTNSTYDRVEDYKRSIRSINELIEESDDILKYLADPQTEVGGFNEQQMREEKLKAQLLQRSHEWRELVLKAERHGYFRGQIEFLFEFCGVLGRWMPSGKADWNSQEDSKFRSAFGDYLAKASAIFAHDGLTDFGDYRWERALLAVGDYLLFKGRYNLSFLNDSDRDASWKRLLRGGMRVDDPAEAKRRHVKTVLDKIDLNIGVARCLDAAIAQSNPPDEWRRLIVRRPAMVTFCKNRMIRLKSPDCIYLLKKIRMSGEHAELFSYELRLGLLEDKKHRNELVPFDELGYSTVNSEGEEPRAYLVWRRGEEAVLLKVTNRNGKFELKVSGQQGGVFAQLKTKLGTYSVEQDGAVSRIVERDKIDETLDELVSVSRSLSGIIGPPATVTGGADA